MAKSAAKADLVFDVDFTCRIVVPKSTKKTFEKDLKGRKLALSTSMDVKDDSFSFVVRPDNVEGTFSFDKIDDENYQLVLKGKYKIADVFNALPAIRKLKAPPKLVMDHVYDLDRNEYFIDGEEDKKMEIGTHSI